MNKPSRRDRMRPLEYVGLSGVASLIAGAIVLMVTRDPLFAALASGIVFVVVIIGIAMLVLAMNPNKKAEGEWEKPETGND